MLDAFPTPGHVTALSKDAFIDAAWDVVGRKVSKREVLGDIYETAKWDCQEFRVRAAIMDPMEVLDGTTQSSPHS